jgi:DNA-directed RNA polymerase subunit H (RpoH/RPB5)
MQVELKNLEGNGSILGPSLISYQYSEDVTSLEPSTLSGGTGQVNVTAIAVSGDKVDNTHPDSKLLINNKMLLTHTESGEVEFSVKQVNKNIDVVSIVGDTLQAQLNKEVTAGPHGGSGYTLLSALQYYCELAGISAENDNLVFSGTLADELDSVPANFVGWNGNLWEYIKMFCAAVSASETNNVGIEAYIDLDTLVFRKAKTSDADFKQQNLSSQSISIDSFDAAQKFEIFNYNTSYKINSVVQSLSVNKENLPAIAKNATVSDAIQVNAGETVKVRLTINASLETVNTLSPVDSILPLPYTGSLGQYVVAGNDGILLKATQWTAEGGSVTAALTENPNEIEITVKAPAAKSLPQASGAELGLAPYKVGVEVADGEDYPALYVTGTGVFYEKTSHTINTGADVSFRNEVSAPSIDNPFITNMRDLYNNAAAAAQAICGPNVQLSEDVSTIESFGETPGKLRLVESNRFRISSVSYSEQGTSISASPSATFADFNAKWTGLDFADFTSTVLDPDDFPNETLKFNEFTVIPLMNPEPVA